MKVTIILSLAVMAEMFLLLWAAVALVQDRRLFGSAPGDVQELIQPKPERFKGQHFLGWVLLILSLLMLIAAAVFAVWNGVRNNFGFWQFFARFLTILYAYKAYDMICFDFLLLTRTHFFQRYYPEVDVCESCHKYGFNLKSQILRIIIYPFLCALAAWICTFLPQ